MNPSRPYKCTRDIIDDAGKMHSMEMTVNLFDVDNFCECSNDLEGFKDGIKRTTIFLADGKCFLLRISYKEFDAIILQMKEDYQMLDTRSMNPPDKIKYKGFIQISAAIKPQFMVVTFHRKGYRLKGNSKQDFDEFSHNVLFNYIYPMN